MKSDYHRIVLHG